MKALKYLEESEILKVLAEAKKHGVRSHAMFLLAYTHGLRVTEIATLTLADVRHGQINVRRLKGSNHTIQQLIPHTNPLLDEPTVLAAWLAVRGTADGSRVLFTSRQGSGLTRQQIHSLFEDIAIRSGIERGRRNIHILKHSIISNLLRNGASVAHIQVWAGHVDAKNTLKYCNVSDREASQAVGGMMGKMFATV